MKGIDKIGNRPDPQSTQRKSARQQSNDGKKFGKVMSAVADGALETASAVGSVVPGGGIVSAAARGLKAMKEDAETLDTREQLDKMWEMQRENQAFNLEYLELQTAIQAENRRYTTVSNLMKAHHDTAKAAINNMKV